MTGRETVVRRVVGVERAVSLLRVAAVGLFAAAERLPPGGDSTGPFFALLAAYLVWSVGLAILSWRRPSGHTEGLVISGVDVLVISVLCALSGGAYSLVSLGYFFVPVAVAFRYRPSLTLAAAAIAVVGFVAQPVLDIGASRDEEGAYVAVWAGFLAWVGLSCTILSAVIARRIREVTHLSSDRERLLAEVMAAESRERQRLSEGLHDGAIQTLLAVRHDLEHATLAAPQSEELARADEALLDAVRQLRSTIFEMHPHVLEAAGLEAAVRQVGQMAARRGGFDLTLELDELPNRAANDRVLFSVFRELITNVVKHAGARQVTVTLRSLPDTRVLIVADDGHGFDAAAAEERLTRGHIGLRSQRVRLETVGGTLEISRGEDGGTVAAARVPA